MPGNFAIRLRCPLCEADSWVTLADRRETYEQIQEQTWDFKCREHGAQQGTPQEVIGVAPLDEKPASTEKSALLLASRSPPKQPKEFLVPVSACLFAYPWWFTALPRTTARSTKKQKRKRSIRAAPW